ncbi:hypothetical protein Hanom_Chr09g00759941 [Helianthus anomalus]
MISVISNLKLLLVFSKSRHLNCHLYCICLASHVALLIIFRVNYKFCPLCLHQIAGAVLFSKSLQAVSLNFQNLARYVL